MLAVVRYRGELLERLKSIEVRVEFLEDCKRSPQASETSGV